MDTVGTTHHATLAGQTVGGYEIQQLIGVGGMGEVYQGFDTKLKRAVAVKALRGALAGDKLARRRFVRETKLATQVVHPYVATVFDVVQEQQNLFLVMEYIEGSRLDQLLKRERPSPHQMARFGLEIAEALSAIHEKGLVHRDLKPSNVMITPAGHVKVMDFGVARSSVPVEDPKDATLTREGFGVGTVMYMSPEQVQSNELDQRSDLFSLGAILYEAITGEHPFRRDTVMATASAIITDPPGGGSEPKTLTDSGPLRQVVMRLLAKNPEHRYSDAETVIGDLRTIVEGVGGLSRDPVRQARIRRVLTATLPAVLLASVMLLLWRFYPTGDPVALAAPRPMVAVLPFFDRTGEYRDRTRGEMLGALLAADLSQSRLVRTPSSDRMAQVVAGLPRDTALSAQLEAMRTLTRSQWILAGQLFRQGEIYEAIVEVYSRTGDEPVGAFRVSAAGTATLVDLASIESRKLMFPGADTEADPDVAVASLSSDSEEARLLEFRARAAIREYRLDEAIQLLEEATQIDPGFLGAHIRLAEVLDDAGYSSRAREVVAQALRGIETAGQSPTARLGLEVRAVHAAVMGNLSAVAEIYQELADSYRDEPRPQLRLASILTRVGRTDEALVAGERAIDLDPLDPQAHIILAETFGLLGRYGDAKAALDTSRQLWEQLGSESGLAFVELERGHLEYNRAEFETALAHYSAAESRFRAVGLDGRATMATKAKADTNVIVGNTAIAEAHYAEVISGARATGDQRTLIKALTGLGAVHYSRGGFDEAERALRQALEEGRALGNPSLLLTPRLTLAGVLIDTGRLTEGRALAEESLDVARDIKDQYAEELALTNLADVHFQQGRLADALNAWRDLLQLAGSTAGSSEGLAYAHAGFAEVSEVIGATKEGYEAIDAAVRLELQLSRQLRVAYDLVLRARLAGHLALWDAAELDLEQAESIATDLGDRFDDLLHRIVLERALLALKRGRWHEARQHLVAIHDETSRSSAVGLAAPAATALCESELSLGNAERALALCLEALDSPAALPFERTATRIELANVWRALGDDEQADREGRRAHEDAGRFGAHMLVAASAVSLLRAPRQPDDADELRTTAERAVSDYLNAAPAARREEMKARADLEEILRGLRARPATG